MQPEPAGHKWKVRDATRADIAALAALSEKTFTDKFGHIYSEADLNTFIDEAHSPAFYEDLFEKGADYLIRVAETEEGALAAYLVCSPLSLPAVNPDPSAVELKRLYVDAPLQGRGLGSHFMDEAFIWAAARGAREMYLSVFSENEGAYRLYLRRGFEKVDEFFFPVGEHRDLEFLLRKKL
ncbi:GNAT family N-acetyltransferase [Henriciella litoralis]|uniref:GNAT family N-acetyltransferase n=1 Tax=Henriciella litoralis TaxID=568102 RepID=UPI0009FCA65C|nr:GNAT family N-acetyltransferase [Henriciella litoralis]